MRTIKHILYFLLVFILVTPCFVKASSTDGTIDSTYKYAWNSHVGWVNFGTSAGNVHVTDSQLTGSIWIPNAGWIALQVNNAGVSNNGEGTLSGYGWGDHTGYVGFYGVTIDSEGFFHGYATTTSLGDISLNCLNTNSCAQSDFKVKTDWRPASVRNSSSDGIPPSSGGGGGGWIAPISQSPISLLSKLGTTTLVNAMMTANVISAISGSTTSEKVFSDPALRCPYFTKSLLKGDNNKEVKLLQSFLMYYKYMASTTPNTYFDENTYESVKRFQKEYRDSILVPWNLPQPTGNWLITSRKKANEIVGCVPTGILSVSLRSGYLNVRATPSLSAKILTKFAVGQKFNYYDKSGNWYYLDYAPGKSGWVYGQYITVIKKSILEK